MGWKLHNTGGCRGSVSRRNFFGLSGQAWKDPSNVFTWKFKKMVAPMASHRPKTLFVLCLLKKVSF